MTSKCDVVRDAARAAFCGMCGRDGPPPAGCGSPPPPAAACRVPTAANLRMRAAREAWGWPGDLVRVRTLENYRLAIADADRAVAEAYPRVADSAVSWGDVDACLWDPAGYPGGPNGNVYFSRADAAGVLGMQPTHLVGGDALAGLFWAPGTSPVPLAFDRLANPDLFAAAVIAFILLVFLAMVATARGTTAQDASADAPLSKNEPSAFGGA
jgi:hypothetical protein